VAGDGHSADAWANAHRIPVEEGKKCARAGPLHSSRTLWRIGRSGHPVGRHPEMMKRMKEMRQQGSLPHAPKAMKSGLTVPKTR